MNAMIPQHAARAWTVLALVTAAVGSAQSASAQDTATPVTLGAALEFRTRYLFAGIPFSSGAVVNGGIKLGYGGLTLNALTNYDLELEEINEGDVWGDYYHQFNALLGGFVGAALYNFKFLGEWHSTPELYAGLVLAVPGTPTLYFARDFDLTTGDHTVLTLTHAIPAGNVSVRATGRVEFNNGYYRDFNVRYQGEDASFSYADLSISVPVVLGRLTITPMAVFLAALADDFEDRVVGAVNAQIALR